MAVLVSRQKPWKNAQCCTFLRLKVEYTSFYVCVTFAQLFCDLLRLMHVMIHPHYEPPLSAPVCVYALPCTLYVSNPVVKAPPQSLYLRCVGQDVGSLSPAHAHTIHFVISQSEQLSVQLFWEAMLCSSSRCPRHAVQPNRVFILLERFHQRGDAYSFSSSCQTSLHLLLLLPPGSFPLPLIFSLLLPPSLHLSSLSLLHLYMNSLIAYTSFLLPFLFP